MLGKVVLRYLDGMDEPLINSIQAILRATMGGRSVASTEGIAALQSLCQEVGCPYHDELCSTTCCVALVVLWMGLWLSSASDAPMPPRKDDDAKGSSDEEASDSSGSNSDVSSQDDSSDVSDLEKFDEAYTDFSALTDGVDPQTLERHGSGHPNDEVPGIDLPGGMEALYSLANVPKSWPLARLTIPLSAASKHLERLLEGCCMEIFVRNTNPDSQLHFVRKFAKDLVVVFAFHLAETISALFRHVLDHPSKVLYDPETEPLFLPIFWFYPIYREMLNSASRHRPSKSMELRRAASGLVKVICRTEESRPGGKGRKPGKPKKKGLLASFEDWFGSINMMNILYVWFPASWGPSVVEAIQKRNVTCLANKPIVRDPHIFDRKEAAKGSRAREVTCRIKSGTSKLKVSILSWLPMQELIGLPWMMMTSRRSFPSYSKASCKMCSHRGHPLRGKEPNHKNSQYQCSSQGPVLLQNGETYYNPDANSGPH